MRVEVRRIGPAIVAAAVMVSVAAGCSDDKNSSSSSSTTSASATASATAGSSTAASPTRMRDRTPTSRAPGANQTIDDYVAANHIASTQIKQGDTSAPDIDLAVPTGWKVAAAADTPDWAWGAIQYKKPVPGFTPTVFAVYTKLSGKVEMSKLMELAPNELKNQPGYAELAAPNVRDFAGYQSIGFAGTTDRDGKPMVVAQRIVFIPVHDDIYELQLNAYANPDDVEILNAAGADINQGTKITLR